MKLPDKFERVNLIGKMKVGDTGYVVPLSMSVDSNGDCWLHLADEYSTEPNDSFRLKIKRLENGFKVFIHGMKSDYRWKVPKRTVKETPTKNTSFYGYVVEFDTDTIFSSLKAQFFG